MKLSRVFHKLTTASARGFSLIELAIVLMIMGVLAGAVLKGKDLLDVAKARAVIQDFERFRMAINLYQETHNALPGDDGEAKTHFGGDVQNGDGDGVISAQESKLFWLHLAKGKYVTSEKAPPSKWGGIYTVIHEPSEDMPGHWLRLGQGPEGDQGLLTPQQAQMLKSKGDDEKHPLKGTLRFGDGKGAKAGSCIKDGTFNLSVTTACCVVYGVID